MKIKYNKEKKNMWPTNEKFSVFIKFIQGFKWTKNANINSMDVNYLWKWKLRVSTTTFNYNITFQKSCLLYFWKNHKARKTVVFPDIMRSIIGLFWVIFHTNLSIYFVVCIIIKKYFFSHSAIEFYICS